LRILEIGELKSVPGTPTSHLFIERVIGTTRREYLDQLFFFTGLICKENTSNDGDGKCGRKEYCFD
jgi:hypothetical protein